MYSPCSHIVGRFAPSPTGPLHFGSLLTAVASYCRARQQGGEWRVRIEDLDTPRVQPGAADDILRTLEALGLFWDGEVIFQSRRTSAYERVLESLREKGLVFACSCSRREILASAPHPGEEGPVYPGTCRAGLVPGRTPRAWRLRVSERPVGFVDGVFGVREQCLRDAVGDFVLRRADGVFAYQLAVVVDDAEAGVNEVVRGLDLLGSTPRQVYLHACLDLPVPHYVHLPLALDAGGEKISKRHLSGPTAWGGGDLWRALRFLGQEIPEELRSAPAPEVLCWGMQNFSLDRVPRQSRVVEGNS